LRKALGLIEESPPNKRSSRKTFPVVSRSSNRGNCFRKGGSCNWSPRKIREEVATLFKASLPTQRSSGSLYPLEAQDSGYVKIGYTLGDWHKRKSEIKKQAHIEMDDNNEHALEDIPFGVLLRLEKLVHTDLSEFQRYLPYSSTEAQHEWFEIDFDVAKETAYFWMGRLEMLLVYLDLDARIIGDDDNSPGVHMNHEHR
jgi:hypothetical protein